MYIHIQHNMYTFTEGTEIKYWEMLSGNLGERYISFYYTTLSGFSMFEIATLPKKS